MRIYEVQHRGLFDTSKNISVRRRVVRVTHYTIGPKGTMLDLRNQALLCAALTGTGSSAAHS